MEGNGVNGNFDGPETLTRILSHYAVIVYSCGPMFWAYGKGEPEAKLLSCRSEQNRYKINPSWTPYKFQLDS